MEKVESLLNIKLDSEPVYGDNDKYIKTKKEHMVVIRLQIFKAKACQKKKHHVSVHQ